MSRDSSSRKRKLDTETASCHEVNHDDGFFVLLLSLLLLLSLSQLRGDGKIKLLLPSVTKISF